PLLLATNYVNSKAAERLHGCTQFIDTAGNAFLDQPSLYIYVKGNKPEKEEIARPIGRIFKGIGLKIPFLLLCRPELTDRPYRELAKMTSVALGTVSSAIAEMIQKGYLLEMRKQLLNRKTLFERWIPAYADYLKPKLLLGRFHGEGDWWKNVHLDPAIAQWGGEVAAAKLTKDLKPGTSRCMRTRTV
ncbi:MAG: type IV toxin-antitoxin system AbiEi family antitoxin, partial [Geobacteraceae bacterium]|nr:type IV toxin-antitoxin system AbiEi family antitoxin [Geobacteraceae bacterium]